ncbi:MAG: HD domain-containing phosphohydrolase [Pseudomonadota bacterium]|jgi:PAS domain S-box-containing protein
MNDYSDRLQAKLSAERKRLKQEKDKKQRQALELAVKARKLEGHDSAFLPILEELEHNRRQLEQAHREWEDAFDAMSDAIFIHDEEFRIIRANVAYAEFAGMPIKKVIGKNYWEVFPRHHTPLPSCACVTHQGTEPIEETIETGDGKIFISRAFAIHDARNRYLYSIHILQNITEHERAVQERQRQLENLRDGLEATIEAMAAVIELRDPGTAGHQRRVADLAAAIAEEMGLPEEQTHGIRLAGIVHDLGKIQVEPEILNKPARLDEAEFNAVKAHSQASYDILKDIEFPWPIAQMVLQHHERLDGSGYPHGIKGEEILTEAKILGVADVVEAMWANRAYRPGLGIDAALEEISAHRGILYAPEVVDACIRLFREKGFAFSP